MSEIKIRQIFGHDRGNKNKYKKIKALSSLLSNKSSLCHYLYDRHPDRLHDRLHVDCLHFPPVHYLPRILCVNVLVSFIPRRRLSSIVIVLIVIVVVADVIAVVFVIVVVAAINCHLNFLSSRLIYKSPNLIFDEVLCI